MKLRFLGLDEVMALHSNQIERYGGSLERCGGNRSEAARRLGIARTQPYAKIEEYALAPRSSEKPPPGA